MPDKRRQEAQRELRNPEYLGHRNSEAGSRQTPQDPHAILYLRIKPALRIPCLFLI